MKNRSVVPVKGLQTILFILLALCSNVAFSQVSYYSDDFEDNDLTTGSMVWSGTTSAFAGTTAITGNGTYSMGVNTGNTPRTIYKQYGTSTNLNAADYTWSFTFTTTTITATDPTNSSTHGALTTGSNSWRYWLAASATTSGSNGYYLTQDGARIKFVRTNGSNEKYSPFQMTVDLVANTKYAVRVTRTSGNLWRLYIDANTDNATTQQGSTNEGTYFNSGTASIFAKIEANTTSANTFKFDNIYFGLPSVTMAGLTNGLAATVLAEGATNQALIGVSVTPTGSSAVITGLNFPNTNSNSSGGTYTNGKLVRSTDNDFSTTGDNTTISANVYLQGSYVEVSGMSVTVAAGTTANFFLVFDMQSTFGGGAPSTMQFSMTQANVFTDLIENSFSITSPTYTLSRVYTWNGNSSTNWNTASNWTYNGGTSTTVPGAGNAVRIGVVSFNNQPTVSNNLSVASISFGILKTAVLTVNSGSTLTVSGAVSANIIDDNKDINISVTGAGSISAGSVSIGGLSDNPNPNGSKTTSITSTISSFTVSGNVNLISVMGSSTSRLNNAAFYLQSGTMIVNGSIVTNNTNASNVSVFEMNSSPGTATLNLSSSTPFSLSATGTSTMSFAGTSATVIYSGTTQNIPASTYTNLTVSGAGDKTATGVLTVNGVLTIGTGLNLDMGINQLSGATLTTSGTGGLKTQNTGSTPLPSGRTWTTSVLYNGTSTQSIAAGTYNNLTLTSSTSAKTANGAVTVNGALTVSSGSILDMATYQLLGSLTSVGSTGGIIKTQDVTTTPIPTGKTWVTDILYNATGSQTVVAGDYKNLNISGGNRTLVNGGIIGLTGVLTPGSGTITSTGNTVEFKGSVTQTIPAMVYNNVTISNAAKTADADFTVNGALTIGSGLSLDMVTYQLLGSSLTTSGTGSITTQNNGSTPLPSGRTWTMDISYNGSSSQSVAAGTYNNLTITGSTSNKTATGALAVNGALTISSSSVLDMGTGQLLGSLTSVGNAGGIIKTQNTGTTPIPTGKTWVTDIYYNAGGSQTVVAGEYKNLNIAGGNRTLASGGTIGITGILTPSSGTITSSGNTVEFKGTAAQAIAGMAYNNVVISNASKTAAMDFTVNGLLTINSGLTLDMGTYQLLGNTLTTSVTGTLKTQNTGSAPLPSGRAWAIDVYYNSASSQTVVAGTYNNLIIAGGNRTLINSGTIAVAGTLTTGSGTITTTSSTVDFNGTGAQTIPVIAYNNLTISNNGGVKALAGSTTVGGALSLTGGKLTIGAGNTLTLNGTFSGSASNSLTSSASSNITVGGTGALGTLFFNQTTDQTTNNIATLTINRTSSGTLTLGNNINISSLLQLTNGTVTLAANDTVTLRSTSITNTAMVGQVGSSAGFVYGTGAAFRIERFIPQNSSNNNRGVRAFRDLAPGVNSGSLKIFDQWQEGGINTNGYGTHITGKAGIIGLIDATTGFDMTASGSKSLQSFNVSTVDGNAAWANLNSTKTDTLSAFKGLRIFIRGNRATSLVTDLAYMSSPATLRSTGKLITGSVTYRATGVTNNGVTNTGIQLNHGSLNGFTIIPNPYAAPIDWYAVYASSSNILPNCWIYDPNVGTAGAYVAYNQTTGVSSNPSASAVNRYIQPGQSFFVKNNNSINPVVVINEAHKAISTSNLTAVFGAEEEQISKLVLSLHKKVDTTYVNMDGTVMCYKSTFDKAIGLEDAGKITNANENLAVYSNETLLSIEGRTAATTTDSIRLRLWQTTAGASYKLKLDLTAYASTGLQPVLKDRLTNGIIKPAMNGITEYNFTTTTDTLSYNYRFTIVFVNASSVLPVTFHSVKAYQKQTGNNVQWTVTETGADNYEVEYSADGRSFSSISKISALGINGNTTTTYEYYHNTPSAISYYRIKSNDKNGAAGYSNIVTVSNNGNKNAVVTVYPNPVKNKTANVIFSNLAAGSYQLSVYSNDGRLVHQKNINHNGLTGSYNVSIPQSLPAGTYNLKVSNDTLKYSQLMVIE